MTGEGRRDRGHGSHDDNGGGWGRGELEPERRLEPPARTSRRRSTASVARCRADALTWRF